MAKEDIKIRWIIKDNIYIACNKINKERFAKGKKFIEEESVRKEAEKYCKANKVEMITATRIIKDKLWAEMV